MANPEKVPPKWPGLVSKHLKLWLPRNFLQGVWFTSIKLLHACFICSTPFPKWKTSFLTQFFVGGAFFRKGKFQPRISEFWNTIRDHLAMYCHNNTLNYPASMFHLSSCFTKQSSANHSPASSLQHEHDHFFKIKQKSSKINITPPL